MPLSPRSTRVATCRTDPYHRASRAPELRGHQEQLRGHQEASGGGRGASTRLRPPCGARASRSEGQQDGSESRNRFLREVAPARASPRASTQGARQGDASAAAATCPICAASRPLLARSSRASARVGEHRRATRPVRDAEAQLGAAEDCSHCMLPVQRSAVRLGRVAAQAGSRDSTLRFSGLVARLGLGSLGSLGDGDVRFMCRSSARAQRARFIEPPRDELPLRRRGARYTRDVAVPALVTPSTMRSRSSPR